MRIVAAIVPLLVVFVGACSKGRGGSAEATGSEASEAKRTPLREGDLTEGTVEGWSDDGLVIRLVDGRSALLPDEERIYGSEGEDDPYPRDQHVWCLVVDSHGERATVSHTRPALIQALLARRVPEVREGTVSVAGVARSNRHTKVALTSKTDRRADTYVDAATREWLRAALGDRQLDIVVFDGDPVRFFTAAVGSRVKAQVRVNKAAHSIRVVIENDEDADSDDLALAAKLTGWPIEIVPHSLLSKRRQEALHTLQKLPGVDAGLAAKLVEKGVESPAELVAADEGVLRSFSGDERSRLRKAMAAAASIEKAQPAAKGAAEPDPEVLKMLAEARELRALVMGLARKIRARVPGITDVNIAISGESATVTGRARSEADRSAATQIILDSGKVKKVDNAIQIAP